MRNFTALLILGLHLLAGRVEAVDAGESAVWSVQAPIDKGSEQALKRALVGNQEGHELIIERVKKGGRVYGTLLLSNRSPATLDQKELPSFSIDEGPRHQIEESDSRIFPKRVHFLLWHGEGRTPISGLLRDLMDGRKVVFRYSLGSEGYGEISFSLVGAKKAIAEAVEVAEDPSAEERDRDEAKNTGYHRCFSFTGSLTKAMLLKCLTAVDVCAELQSLDEARACIDRVKISDQ
jgi:hypothetical protein